MTVERSHATPALSGELIKVEEWGEVDDLPVQLITLDSFSGVRVSLTTYGATLVSVEIPRGAEVVDSDSVKRATVEPAASAPSSTVDVLLGLTDLAAYLRPHPHLGGVIGRVANRVSGAAFELAGVRYQLSANQSGLQLHGGVRGFDRRVWKLEDAGINAAGHACATLSY